MENTRRGFFSLMGIGAAAAGVAMATETETETDTDTPVAMEKFAEEAKPKFPHTPKFPHIEITGQVNGRGKLLIDGVEQRGVRKVSLDLAVGKITTVTVEYVADKFSFSGEAKVERHADITNVGSAARAKAFAGVLRSTCPWCGPLGGCPTWEKT